MRQTLVCGTSGFNGPWLAVYLGRLEVHPEQLGGLRTTRRWGRDSTIADAGQKGDVRKALRAECRLGSAIEFRIDATLGRKLPGETARDVLLLAQPFRQGAGRQGPYNVIRQTDFAGDGGMGIQLVVGPPDGADRKDDDLPHPLAERRAGLLRVLQVQEGRRYAGAEHDRVERPDQPTLVRHALEAGLIGPPYHGGAKPVVHRLLGIREVGRVEQRQAAAQICCVHVRHFLYWPNPTALEGTSKALSVSDTPVNQPSSMVTSTIPASPNSAFARR